MPFLNHGLNTLKAPTFHQTSPQETCLEEFRSYLHPSFHPSPRAVCCHLEVQPPPACLPCPRASSVTNGTNEGCQPILCRSSSPCVVSVSFGYDRSYHQLSSHSKHQVGMVSAAVSGRSQQTSWLCPLNVSLIEHPKAEGLRHILCPSFHLS